MQISDEMVAKALAESPSLDAATVRKMLRAALSGSLVMIHEGGQTAEGIAAGHPDYLQVDISDAYTALDLTRQLVTAVQHQPGAKTLERPIHLMLAGRAEISYDD